MGLILLVAIASLASRVEAVEEYQLEIGDVVEFAATGDPGLTSRAMIGVDGAITLPLVGQMQARGLSLTELRTRIQKSIVSKVYRRRGADGEGFPSTLAPDEVSLRIAEFRPVYLNGDVSKPGEISFRPGMTVRQGVALAGGYDIMRFRMSNPFLEQADLRSEYESMLLELARTKALQQRLATELANKTGMDDAVLTVFPIGAKASSRILELESNQLTLRNALHRKNREYLESGIRSADRRIAVLTEQQDKEKAGQIADEEDFQRAEASLKRGNAPITRVMDARRTILLSSTRLLQTIALRFQVEREREELNSRLAKLDDENRTAIFSELREAQAKEELATSRLRAVTDKLAYVGMVRSQLVSGVDAKPRIVIIRRNEHGSKRIEAEEESELTPGDVVEIMLQKGFVPTTADAR